MERLALDCQLREYKDQVIQKLNSSKEFRKSAIPKINKFSKSISRSYGEIQTPNHLYEDAFLKNFKMNVKRNEKKRNLIRNLNKKKSSNMSDRIIDTIIKRKAEEIFEILDGDKDGVISSQRIDISRIDGDKLKILAPMLIEMEQMQIVLNMEEFSEAFKKLMREINVIEKNLLLGFFGERRKAFTGSMQDCTFRVKIFFQKIFSQESIKIIEESNQK